MIESSPRSTFIMLKSIKTINDFSSSIVNAERLSLFHLVLLVELNDLLNIIAVCISFARAPLCCLRWGRYWITDKGLVTWLPSLGRHPWKTGRHDGKGTCRCWQCQVSRLPTLTILKLKTCSTRMKSSTVAPFPAWNNTSKDEHITCTGFLFVSNQGSQFIIPLKFG